MNKLLSAVQHRVDELVVRLGNWMWVLRTRGRSEAGQTVAEYALVLLVVAAIAVAFLLWAKQSGRLDSFFNAVFDKLVNSVDPEQTPAP